MLHFRPLFSLVFHIVSLDFLFDHNYILLLDCINSKSVCRSTEFCFPVSFDSFLSESIWYIPCSCIFYNIALGAAVKARGIHYVATHTTSLYQISCFMESGVEPTQSAFTVTPPYLYFVFRKIILYSKSHKSNNSESSIHKSNSVKHSSLSHLIQSQDSISK